MTAHRQTPLTNAEISEEEALATRYVLGEMSEEEFANFEARYASDDGFRARYDAWSARLDQSSGPMAQRSLLDGFRGWLTTSDEKSYLRRLGVVPAVLGALAAALLVGFVSNGDTRVGPETRTEPQTALQAILVTVEGQELADVGLGPDNLSLNVVIFGMLDLTEGDTQETVLEVWLGAGGSVPVSLGTMPIAQQEISLPIAPRQVEILPGAVLTLTKEPFGGAGDVGPTGEVVAVGAFVAP